MNRLHLFWEYEHSGWDYTRVAKEFKCKYYNDDYDDALKSIAINVSWFTSLRLKILDWFGQRREDLLDQLHKNGEK